MENITEQACKSYIEDLKVYEDSSYKITYPDYDWKLSFIAFRALQIRFSQYGKSFAEEMPDTDLEIFEMDTTDELIDLVEYFQRHYYILDLQGDERNKYLQQIDVDEFDRYGIENTILVKCKEEMEDVTEKACQSYIEDLRNFEKGEYSHEYSEYNPKLSNLAFKVIASVFHSGSKYDVYNNDLLTFNMKETEELVKLVQDFQSTHIIYLLEPVEKVCFHPSNVIVLDK